ncbi:NAD(P)H-hydrate epimerase [miscellaneous Crenarchaeota group archaeon SMTZ1-55]|nr:MAG: NAD(P)H-hydrate epimerase [miscellaneous Crenarchaeota group archaeon SMTZ1-55]
MKVCWVSEIRQLDDRAQRDFGITEEVLMENAGQSVYFVILTELGVQDRNFVIFCGPGNKGGDGFVVARKIHSSGGLVKVFLLSERGRYRGAARSNLDRIEKMALPIRELGSVDEAADSVENADAIVDGVFGTGLDRNVEGLYKDVIDLINASRRTVVAIDIPSGINGDTGWEMGVSVKADYTITFGLPKLGNLLYPGYGRGGKLFLSHISYPLSLQKEGSLRVELSVGVKLPERSPNTTKFDYGPLLVIAGASTYHWAPFASAYSFLKSGGGYVYLACPASLVPSIAQAGREIVFQPQKETGSHTLSLENRAELLDASQRMLMTIIGPGLSLNEDSQQLVRILAKEIDTPLLIDGDGITAIAQEPETIRERKNPTVLTPHTGEMARLTGIERFEIERTRVDVLQRTAADLNAIIVLKGPHTLIGYPDASVFISLSGDTGGKAGLATAGSGDVLNGTIAAMHALGLGFDDAVRTGVFIHGLAGDLAAQEKGPDGMTARDILNHLPCAVKYYRENFEKITANFYGKCQII